MRLARFRLRTQMLFGFGILIVLLLGVAGFGSFGLSGVSNEVRRMDNLTGNMRRSQEILFRTEIIRRALTRYRIDRDAQSLHDSIDAEARTGTLLADAAQVTTSQERRTLFVKAADELRVISTKREQFVSLSSAADAERKALDATGALLQADIERLPAALSLSQDAAERNAGAAAQIALMSVRIANLKFQVEPSPQLADVFGKEASMAKHALVIFDQAASHGIKPLIKAINASLERYILDFARGSSTLLQANTLYDNDIRQEVKDLQSMVMRTQETLSVALDEASRDALAVTDNTLHRQIGLTVIGSLLGVALALLIARSIVRPVTGMTFAMNRLAAGDTALEVPGRNHTDEIGEMARAVEVFRQQAIENVQLARDRDRQRGEKDRRQVALDLHIQDFGKSVSGVMSGFSASAEAMREAATSVSEGARKTRSSTSTTAEGAVTSAQDLNAVAAAAEQMAVSINEISRQVSLVTTSVQSAVDRATETDAKVGSLSEAADRIGDVVQLINNIASQTNLLALNATIEAARAGEAGKGFAVVAGEVKALATQTARATEQISRQILTIRAATNEAVNAVRDVTVAIGEVETVATVIAGAVGEQAAATQEITNSVQAVSATTSVAAEALRSVLAIAENTEMSSQEALAASMRVGETANSLRTEVTDFLSAISGGTDADRRLYERIPAHGATARMSIAGHPPMQVTIRDISRGGLAVLHSVVATPGTHVDVDLPGGVSVKARVVRASGGSVALALRQDEASLRLIDHALAIITKEADRKAA